MTVGWSDSTPSSPCNCDNGAGRLPLDSRGRISTRTSITRFAQTDMGDGTVKYVPRVDENVCAAHGDCVDIAPDVFALNDVAHVIGDGPPS